MPAINSLLGAIGDAPARVFLEAGRAEDRELPVARNVGVAWVDRKNGGKSLVEAVYAAVCDSADGWVGQFGWVASDNHTTRAVARIMREDFGIPRKSIKAQACRAV